MSLIEAQASGLQIVMSDSITEEVCITDNIYKMSLTSPQSEWAEKVIEISKIKRNRNFSALYSSNWDINYSSKYLIDFYRS